MRSVRVLLLLLALALISPAELSAAPDSQGRTCVVGAEAAGLLGVVPAPPLNPAYARLAALAPSSAGGRCGIACSPSQCRALGAVPEPSCLPTPAQRASFEAYRRALANAFDLESIGAGFDSGPDARAWAILDRELSYGDACRGPLYLAVTPDDFRALSRCLLGLPPLAADPARAPARAGPDCRLFPETQQSACGVILDYWTRYGGLARFGYPLSPLRYEAAPNDPAGVRLAQWFERARFEVHLDAAGRQTVLLGLLGNEVAKRLQDEWPFAGVDDPGDGSWFPETGHTLRGIFRAYWERTGGWRTYGFPISEVFYEVNPDDGRVYAVQYFERNRFERHPEFAGGSFEILLGQLGRQLYQGEAASATVVDSASPCT